MIAVAINLAGKASRMGPHGDWKGRLKMADLEGETGIQIRPYNAPNWVTERGVKLKQKEIERKGLPVFKHCLFLTLTVPDSASSPKKAYEVGKERLRRFLARFRKALGRDFPWAWKLEFQENGYPHWHVIIGYRKRIPWLVFRDVAKSITEWWGLGVTNIQRLRQKDFGYLFKYVSKIASSDGDEEAGVTLPAWVLDYKTIRKDGRPSAGIRFWQTGGGFYSNTKPSKPKQKTEKKSSRVPYTLREQLRLWMRKGVAYRKDEQGNFKACRYFYFKHEFGRAAQEIITQTIIGQTTPVPNANVFKCRLTQLRKEVSEWTLKKIMQIIPATSSPLRMGMVYFSVD